MKRLSIITVNYNNYIGLKRTISSIVNQLSPEVEFIVIDGGSVDGSIELIRQTEHKIDFWCSEPDNGVFNAMNKGIARATGKFVQFINSGDELCSDKVIPRVLPKLSDDAGIFYGDLIRIYPDRRIEFVKMPLQPTVAYFFKRTIAHPCAFIERSLFEKYGYYREDLKISADWAFFIKMIGKVKIPFSHIGFPVAHFFMDGISSSSENVRTIIMEREQIISEYFEESEILNVKEQLERRGLKYFIGKGSRGFRRMVSFIRPRYRY